MVRGVFAAGIVLVAMLALACGGDEAPAPSTPTVTPTMTATPEPMASSATTATASAIPSPTATATPTPFPTPTGPAVSVTGPLLVLSERLEEGAWEGSDARERWVETRRVYLYDIGTEKYWAAFDYRHASEYSRSGAQFSAVRPAGARLIVWSDGQVRRVGLHGYTEAILFEHAWIKELRVSPDGLKLAITYGRHPISGASPRKLLVLDIATGTELLHIWWTDALLAPLREAAPNVDAFSLGAWHGDSGSLSLIAYEPACGWCYPPRPAAIVSLDGGIEMLPEGWVPSPDLRHALRLGEVAGYRDGGKHVGPVEVWEGFDVLDMESGEVWTVAAEEGGGLGVSWWRLWEWTAYIRFEELAAEPEWRDKPRREGEWRILDAATRTILPETESLLREILSPVRSTCHTVNLSPCELWYDERIIWEGAEQWLSWHGLVDLPGGAALRGITLLERADDPVPPAPPAREEMVGPLLIYEVRGDDERALVDMEGGWARTWWVMAYDEGTGLSWKLADRHGPRPAGLDHSSPLQKAHEGVVMGTQTTWWDAGPPVHVGFTGQRTALLERREATWDFEVSPDGRKVAALHVGEGVRILDLVGNELFFHDEETGWDFSAEILDYPDEFVELNARAVVWSAESDRISVWYGDPVGGTGISIVVEPDEPLRETCATDLCSLSPDFHFIVRWRKRGVREYGVPNWHFDIFEFDTDRLLYSLETGAFINWWGEVEWASPTRFAWSREFDFWSQRPRRDAEHAEISVIDVTTGEVEVMDGAEYLARFHPPPRATTDCPPNPAHSCRILLDGEVVGEGRWPTIVGFIELDSPPPPPRGAASVD